MTSKKPPAVLSLALASASVFAQSSSPPGPASTQPELSPAAAYREALRPVEITHASIENWSNTEQASLSVAIKAAAAACATRNATPYSGSDLVDLGRLCALGFVWSDVASSANRYIHEEAPVKPRLAEAYALLINADLQLKEEHTALTDTLAMLGSVPYTTTAADSSTQAIGYMHLLYTIDAVTIAEKRQPLILSSLRTPPVAAPSSADLNPAIGALYKQGSALAELQQLQAAPEDARNTLEALDSALPSTIPTDDLIVINGIRKRYAQLGKPLTAISPIASLAAPPHQSTIPAQNAITVLMLFPDWCAQCTRLAKPIPPGVFAVNQSDAYMYGLLVQTVPPQKRPKATDKNAAAEKDNFNPAYAADSLHGTSTLTVSPSLLDTFNATDFPLLIFTDSKGIVRLFDIGNDSALQFGDTIDSAVALIGSNWPPKPR